jgi:hypothetical protein
MFAGLFPDQMVALAMTEVDRIVNAHPVPVAERPQRIAALEREVEDLAYQEEVLVSRLPCSDADCDKGRACCVIVIIG